MLKYNNTHIFTGYLKQLLSSVNLPTCKIYTREFASYLAQHGEEDPRVLESFNTIINPLGNNRSAVRINYLKNNELYNYFSQNPSLTPILDKNDEIKAWKRTTGAFSWKQSSRVYYDTDKATRGLTRSLNSPGNQYDTTTHEYLGEFLRFLRDYYNINLMSLYNCFNDKIYNNLYFDFNLGSTKITFNSQEAEYRIYAIPVKLFSEYTIAIDCAHGIEMFCGLCNTTLEVSNKTNQFAAKTYLKVNKTLFSQPFVYDKLNVKHWPAIDDFNEDGTDVRTDANDSTTNTYTRWDIANREKDLKLFIKVPTSCKSSLVILEGDYRNFNDTKYSIVNGQLTYLQNHSILNFNTRRITADPLKSGDNIDLNNYNFKPISKLQLLAFNTGESYPFADRLIEYLTGSAITPLDSISDNIKRAQKVMTDNKNYFKIEGLWEDKMQNILYDYMMNSGPIKIKDGKVDSGSQGNHKKLGHTSKSSLYDVLGYVDKDAEKLYASWKKDDTKVRVKDSIQNVDIYVDQNGKHLWDI